MNKRRGWNDNEANREERQRPIEESELRGRESLEWWEEMSEEEYENKIIAEIERATDNETEST